MVTHPTSYFAEGGRFELPKGLTPYPLSKRAHSTTMRTLQVHNLSLKIARFADNTQAGLVNLFFFVDPFTRAESDEGTGKDDQSPTAGEDNHTGNRQDKTQSGKVER